MNPYLQLLKKNGHSADDLPSKPSKAPFVGFVGDTLDEPVNFFHDSCVGFDATNAAANDGESAESRVFWSNLIDRIHWCDILIHALCDVRGDDQSRRDDLIRTRQRMAPDKIDGDIHCLMQEIELLTPKPPAEPPRDCRGCLNHRGRDNNANRYCVSPDGAAQRNDALASPILDCSIATRCRAFQPQAP